METAGSLIDRLALAPHPEGGWYRETWRGAALMDGRASGTAILFLLEGGQKSHWHRVDAAEVWLWHDGDPLVLRTAPGDQGPVKETILGTDFAAGHAVQHVVEPQHWQAATPAEGPHGYSLVSCVVAPGFEFAGFTLAPPGWEPKP